METRNLSATMAVLYRRIETYNPLDTMYHIVLVVLTSLLMTVMEAPDQRTPIIIAVPGTKVLILGSTNTALAVVLVNALFQITLDEPRTSPEEQTNHDQPSTLITMIITICQKWTIIQIRIRNNTLDILLITEQPKTKINSVPSSFNQMYQKI